MQAPSLQAYNFARIAEMVLLDRLLSHAVSTFGFSDAADAIFALRLLSQANNIESDSSWGAVFDKHNWEQTLSSFELYVESNGGSPGDAKRLSARLPAWRMLYQLDSLPGPDQKRSNVTIERAGYEPVDLGSVFHQERLYYPIETLVNTKVKGEGGETSNFEHIDVVVVRSDRTLHSQVESSRSEAGGGSAPIYRLTDGTLLREKLTATQHATWSWSSVSAYLNDRYQPPPLEILMKKVHRHLMAKVWLPDPDDYWMLTFVVALSYVQAVFDAVPLILLNGKGGSGKSGLGTALANVSCNATVIGKSSASSMIRLMNETNGLTVIDDLESIGAAAGKDKFSEMVQVLKVSYTKSTATKLVTNTRRKPQLMSFFGVKVISNTSGVDAILGSRMLHVHTQNMPASEVDSFLAREDIAPTELKALRDDLHCWAFGGVSDISRLYNDMSATSTRREDEIAAPLLVIAQLAGISEADLALKRALSVQTEKKQTFSSPEEGLRHVVSVCARKGMSEVTVAEMSLMLRLAMRQKPAAKDRPVWMRPEWISKRLREWGLVTPGGGRKVMFGYQSRTVILSSAAIEGAGQPYPYQAEVTQFCKGCRECPFKSVGCEIQPFRLKKVGS